jgi:hypothetical protein
MAMHAKAGALCLTILSVLQIMLQAMEYPALREIASEQEETICAQGTLHRGED